jgi:hypothetical protein
MRNFGWFASALVVLFGPGCSAHDDPLLSSGPYQRVEDCALIQQATPTKSVCGGKICTSFQTAEIRSGKNLDPQPHRFPWQGLASRQPLGPLL